MTFTWSPDLETGNTQIDMEHKELIRAINDLMQACAKGKGRDEIAHTMQFLQNYTHTHFSHEEELQQRYAYPDRMNHKRYHTAFLTVVDGLAKKLHKEGPSIVLVGEINMQLGQWLVNHIKQEDRKVAKHLKGR